MCVCICLGQRPAATRVAARCQAFKIASLPTPWLPIRTRPQVLREQEADGNKVVRDTILGPRSKGVMYAKHIAKQKVGLDPTIWQRANHVVRQRASCVFPTEPIAGLSCVLV